MDKKTIISKLKTQIARLTDDQLQKEYDRHEKPIKQQKLLIEAFNPDMDAYKQAKGNINMRKLIQKLVVDEVMRRQNK